MLVVPVCRWVGVSFMGDSSETLHLTVIPVSNLANINAAHDLSGGDL